MNKFYVGNVLQKWRVIMNQKKKKMILKTVHLVIWWHNQNLRFWFWWYSIDENSYESILVYDILYKTLIGAKPLRIRLNKTDGFIRVYYETRYLVLFALEKRWCHLQHV